MLKYVLNSMYVYALSFFKALSGILSSLESIFKNFFWGGCEDNRKIPWIAWNTICLQKEQGGLGVRQLREFNLALLGKWCWRLMVDRGGLWYRVLVARYGETEGRLEVGSRSASYWWREVAKIRDGVGEDEGGWFSERVSRKLGDETSTLFWYDRWLGDVLLCRRFSRLFELAVEKSSTVASMLAPGWEEGGEAWSWSWRLWVWEEELLVECRLLLNNIILQPNVSDRWIWQPDIVGGYMVRGAYQLLTAQATHNVAVIEDLIWHKQVPLKVSILAWRLMRNRLPTKDNLLHRGIIQDEASRCVAGGGNVESAKHLFLHCDTFGSLWQHVRLWLGVVGVEPHSIHDHIYQFTHYLGVSKARRSFLQLLWLLCIWLVWNERNNRLFNNIQTPIIALLEKVKHNSHCWLKANNASFVYGTQRWWSDPLLCLNSLVHIVLKRYHYRW